MTFTAQALQPCVIAVCLCTLNSVVHAEEVVIRTNAGAPVDNSIDSLTVGAAGPILLQDSFLIERLQLHNRERIPERNVHARGATAFGTFTVTNGMERYTRAKVFQTGKQTRVASRWSTVIHGRHSPEFLRDPRGFALKFYTEEGNYDIVGLNFPVFFIRDSIRFPEMIRSLRPNPVSGQQEWWRIWDFFSNYNESIHMFTWLMDDIGIPLNYRNNDGWGVHTYTWVNDAGDNFYVRYWWKSQDPQRMEGFKTDAEAERNQFSFATKDLYDFIKGGGRPSYDFKVQIINASDTEYIQALGGLDTILDTTTEWNPSFPLESDVKFPPFQDVGVLEFNENVKSQFLQNEMIAFAPSRMVPGIEPSDEKMLQGRIFAYHDTQRYRLGVNNQLLPVNRPISGSQFRSFSMGSMNTNEPSQQNHVNYFPSRVMRNYIEADPIRRENIVLNGRKVRKSITVSPLGQARHRYESFQNDQQDRFATRIAKTMNITEWKMQAPDQYADQLQKVHDIWMMNWNSTSPELYTKIMNKLG